SVTSKTNSLMWTGFINKSSNRTVASVFLGRNGLPLRGLAGGNARIKLGGLFAGHSERRPIARCSGEVLGEKRDLPDVVGVMRHLPVDGLHHGVGLGANVNGARKIGIAEPRQRVKQTFPAALPRREKFFARF